ncbi:MAG: RNA polymerase sporulation sigma factor SigK [Oscillospiraceae bacterium]|nr:RNA polymerase sporulation sigma factor SigK [Oscillospiraceae bacterium]
MILSAFLLLLMGSAVLTLRLGGDLGSFPRTLKAEEEKHYMDLWQAGDLEARNKLIEHNLRLVAHIVKKYYIGTADQSDLISIGTIGLIKGISTYKPDRGVKLATYASRCVENEILMHFRSQKKTQGDLSLSEAIDGGGEAGSLSLIDVISVPDDMWENLSAHETYARLRELVCEQLTERECEIITMRYGLGGALPKTQREVAAVCGISRSYVSRIEKRALKKLEEALSAELFC